MIYPVQQSDFSFAKDLFSWNFISAKFRKNKS